VGFGGERSQSVTLRAEKPGIFEVEDAGGVPDGLHLNRATLQLTPISVCNADASRCPVSTGGVPNILGFRTTGGKMLVDSSGVQTIRFEFARAEEGSFVAQPLDSYGYSRFVGQEEAILKTTMGPGDYLVRVASPTFTSSRQLTVRLGQAN
jgi:hypothetical protein